MRPLRFGPLRVALNSGAAGLRVRVGVIPMTSLNTGRPWSPMNLVDLESGLAFGSSIEMIAEFLMRDVEEVRQKAASLKAPVATGQTSMNGLFSHDAADEWPEVKLGQARLPRCRDDRMAPWRPSGAS